MLTKAYQQTWPPEGLTVQMCAYANWAGAYSTDGRLIVMASTHDGMAGSEGLETVFHEAMHQWDGAMIPRLQDAAQHLHVDIPRDLFHSLIFYTAGYATSRVVPGHRPYADPLWACADRHAGAARRRRPGAADRLRQRGQSAGALGGPQPRGRHPAGHGRGPLAHRARVAGRKRHAGRAGLRAGTGAGRMDARSAGGHRAQEHSAVGSLSWRVLGFTGMLATITVFLCGMIPAWQVSGIRPNMALKSAERSTGGSAVLRWRSALMAAEVALALMLLVGGALLWKSFVRVTGVDLGFEADRVLMMLVNLPDLRYPDGARRLAFFQELEQRVERRPACNRPASRSAAPCAAVGAAFTRPRKVPAPSRISAAAKRISSRSACVISRRSAFPF